MKNLMTLTILSLLTTLGHTAEDLHNKTVMIQAHNRVNLKTPALTPRLDLGLSGGLSSTGDMAKSLSHGVATDGTNACYFYICHPDEKGGCSVGYTRLMRCTQGGNMQRLDDPNRWGNGEYRYADIGYDPILKQWGAAASVLDNDWDDETRSDNTSPRMRFFTYTGSAPNGRSSSWSGQTIIYGNGDSLGWDSDSANWLPRDLGIAGFNGRWCVAYISGDSTSLTDKYIPYRPKTIGAINVKCNLDQNIRNWGSVNDIKKRGSSIVSKAELVDIATNGKQWCVAYKALKSSISCTMPFKDPSSAMSWVPTGLEFIAQDGVSIATDGVQWIVSYEKNNAIYYRVSEVGKNPALKESWGQELLWDNYDAFRGLDIATAQLCKEAGAKTVNEALCCKGLTYKEGRCVAPLIPPSTPEFGNTKGSKCTVTVTTTSGAKQDVQGLDAMLQAQERFLSYDALLDKMPNYSPRSNMNIKGTTEITTLKNSSELKKFAESYEGSTEKLKILLSYIKFGLKPNLEKLKNFYKDIDTTIPLIQQGLKETNDAKLAEIWKKIEQTLKIDSYYGTVIKGSDGREVTIQAEDFNSKSLNTNMFLINAAIEKRKEEYYTSLASIFTDPHVNALFDEIEQLAINEDWNCRNNTTPRCGNWKIDNSIVSHEPFYLVNPLRREDRLMDVSGNNANINSYTKSPYGISSLLFKPEEIKTIQEKKILTLNDAITFHANFKNDYTVFQDSIWAGEEGQLTQQKTLLGSLPDLTYNAFIRYSSMHYDPLTNNLEWSHGGLVGETLALRNAFLTMSDYFILQGAVAVSHAECNTEKFADFKLGFNPAGNSYTTDAYGAIGKPILSTNELTDAQKFQAVKTPSLGNIVPDTTASPLTKGDINLTSQGTTLSSGNLGSTALNSARAALAKVVKGRNEREKNKGSSANSANIADAMKRVDSLVKASNEGQKAALLRSMGKAGSSKSLSNNLDTASKNSNSNRNNTSSSGVESGTENSKTTMGSSTNPNGSTSSENRYSTFSPSTMDSSSTSLSGNSGQNSANQGLDSESVLVNELEKNKNQFKREEEDTLFKIVTKAYIRSYPKVLKSKTKLD